MPRYLNQAIAVYLTLARPILLGRREFVIGEEDDTGSAPDVLTGGLWIGEGGAPLGYSAVGRGHPWSRRLTIGRTLSPHDFRRSGATTTPSGLAISRTSPAASSTIAIAR